MLYLKVLDAERQIVNMAEGQNEVNLICERIYQPGDRIILESSEKDIFVWLQFDDAIGQSMVYLKGDVNYPIPFEEKRLHLSPRAFMGDRHLLRVRKARDFEIYQYRNLAFSVVDHHENRTYFPHVSANVETRGESVFAAQNAIDGITVNQSHGEWPYHSWGINMQEDACITLDFGRMVEIDRIVLYTRADFPHDNWWKSVNFTFSDGTTLEMNMRKSSLPHEITFPIKQVYWMEMNQMIKSDEPSPFPALTQIEVYGRERQ